MSDAELDRAVRFDRLGGLDVLRVERVAAPHPGTGEVRVRVHAAGLNPVDAALLSGGSSRYPVTLPSGNGNDFAGVVDAVGEGAPASLIGSRVFGGSRFHAQADHLLIAADRVLAVPDGVPLPVAATLDIVGRTAYAAIGAVGVRSGETVLVSGAAGGLGSLVLQLARLRGAEVIGVGSPASAERIAALGARSVEYGAGLVERVRRAAPTGVDAVLDCAGHGTVAAALELGVPPERINTNADHEAVGRWGVQNRGAHTDPSLGPLRELVDLIARGEVVVTIDAEYPMERVVDAYRDLVEGHTRGKRVLVLSDYGDG